MGKRKKSYFMQCGQKKHKYTKTLAVGMKGFFLTCNNREREAIKEAYNLLQSYSNTSTTQEETCDTTDIEKAIENEKKVLSEENSEHAKFISVDSGAKNVVFIKTSLPDPRSLVTKIFSDLLETHELKSRFIMRFLPVSGTCHATDEKIEKLTKSLLLDVFAESNPEISYGIIVKVRNNQTINKINLISLIGSAVNELNPKSVVNLDNPDLAICFNIIKNVCCISIVKDFMTFSKYNLQELLANCKKIPTVPILEYQ